MVQWWEVRRFHLLQDKVEGAWSDKLAYIRRVARKAVKSANPIYERVLHSLVVCHRVVRTLIRNYAVDESALAFVVRRHCDALCCLYNNVCIAWWDAIANDSATTRLLLRCQVLFGPREDFEGLVHLQIISCIVQGRLRWTLSHIAVRTRIVHWHSVYLAPFTLFDVVCSTEAVRVQSILLAKDGGAFVPVLFVQCFILRSWWLHLKFS